MCVCRPSQVLKELLDTLVDRSVPDDWLKETARAQLREIDWLAECKLLSVDGSEYVDRDPPTLLAISWTTRRLLKSPVCRLPLRVGTHL